eukprot:GHVT01103776.1.p1 GENE.GHVT01103776.1~~GHVT01103776.1.p1  ORF type:complete len:1380 (-),score=180.77 GHVT01103776.1:289-4080(-)
MHLHKGWRLPKMGQTPSVLLLALLLAFKGGPQAHAKIHETSFAGLSRETQDSQVHRRLMPNADANGDADAKWGQKIPVPFCTWETFVTHKLELINDILNQYKSSFKLKAETNESGNVGLSLVSTKVGETIPEEFPIELPLDIAASFLVDSHAQIQSKEDLYEALQIVSRFHHMQKEHPDLKWTMHYSRDHRLQFQFSVDDKSYFLKPAMRFWLLKEELRSYKDLADVVSGKISIDQTLGFHHVEKSGLSVVVGKGKASIFDSTGRIFCHEFNIEANSEEDVKIIIQNLKCQLTGNKDVEDIKRNLEIYLKWQPILKKLTDNDIGEIIATRGPRDTLEIRHASWWKPPTGVDAAVNIRQDTSNREIQELIEKIKRTIKLTKKTSPYPYLRAIPNLKSKDPEVIWYNPFRKMKLFKFTVTEPDYPIFDLYLARENAKEKVYFISNMSGSESPSFELYKNNRLLKLEYRGTKSFCIDFQAVDDLAVMFALAPEDAKKFLRLNRACKKMHESQNKQKTFCQYTPRAQVVGFKDSLPVLAFYVELDEENIPFRSFSVPDEMINILPQRGQEDEQWSELQSQLQPYIEGNNSGDKYNGIEIENLVSIFTHGEKIVFNLRSPKKEPMVEVIFSRNDLHNISKDKLKAETKMIFASCQTRNWKKVWVDLARRTVTVYDKGNSETRFWAGCERQIQNVQGNTLINSSSVLHRAASEKSSEEVALQGKPQISVFDRHSLQSETIMELTSKFPDILFEWHRGKTKNVLKTNKTDGFTFDDFSAPLVRNAARSIQECATDQILNQLQEMALKCRMDNGFPNFQLVAQPKPTVQTGKTNDASSGAADANDASSITTDASTFPLSEPVTVEEETSTGAPSVAASNTCQPCGNNNTEAPGSDSLNLNSDCPEPDQSPQQKLQTQGGHSSNKPVNTCITDVKSSESTTSPTSSSAPSTSSLSGPASPEEHQHTTLTNGAWQIYHQNTKEKLEEIQSITAHCNSSDVSSTTRVVMIYPSPVTKQKKEQKANSLVSVTDQEGQSKAENSLVAGQKKKQKIGIFGKAITRLQRSFRNSPNSKEKKKSKIKSISKETSSQGPTSSNTSLSGWPLAKQTSAGAARSRSAIGESSAPGAVEISLRAATSNSVGDQVRLDLSEQPFSVTTNSDAGRTNEINPTLKRQLVIASFALGLSSLFSLTGWAIWKRKMSGSQRCPKRYTSTQKMTSVEEASSTLRSGSVAVATRLQRGRPGEKGAVTQMGQPAARLHSLDATKPANGLQSD